MLVLTEHIYLFISDENINYSMLRKNILVKKSLVLPKWSTLSRLRNAIGHNFSVCKRTPNHWEVFNDLKKKNPTQ